MSCHDDKFQNFPLSKKLKVLLNSLGSTDMFSGYMLRLGAQENIVKWTSQTIEEHQQHMNSVAFRAVLEKVCCDNNVKLVKKKRRCVLKSNVSDIDTFVQSVSERYDFGDCDIEKISLDIRSCHRENSRYFEMFENLTGLQFLLQSVIENFIIWDRFHYLREQSELAECEVLEIFDPAVSPRGKVIFARK